MSPVQAVAAAAANAAAAYAVPAAECDAAEIKLQLEGRLEFLKETLPKYVEYSDHSLGVWCGEVRGLLDEYCARKAVLGGSVPPQRRKERDGDGCDVAAKAFVPQPSPRRPPRRMITRSHSPEPSDGGVRNHGDAPPQPSTCAFALSLFDRVAQKLAVLTADVAPRVRGLAAAVAGGSAAEAHASPGRPRPARHDAQAAPPTAPRSPAEAAAYAELMDALLHASARLSAAHGEVVAAPTTGVDIPPVLEVFWDVLNVLVACLRAAPGAVQTAAQEEALRVKMRACETASVEGVQAWRDGELEIAEMHALQELRDLSAVGEMLLDRRDAVASARRALGECYAPLPRAVDAALTQCDAIKSSHVERVYRARKTIERLGEAVPAAEATDARRCETYWAALTNAKAKMTQCEEHMKAMWGPLYRTRFGLEGDARAETFANIALTWREAVSGCIARAEDFAVRGERHRAEVATSAAEAGQARQDAVDSEATIAVVCIVEQCLSTVCRAARGAHEASRRVCEGLSVATAKDVFRNARRGYCLQYLMVYRLGTRVEHEREKQWRAAALLERCIDTFDPMAKEYADERVGCAEVIAALVAEYAEASDRLVRREAEVNNAVMHLAEGFGIVAPHPRDEMEGAVLQRREDLLAMRAEVARTEQERILEEGLAVAVASAQRSGRGTPQCGLSAAASPARALDYDGGSP